MTSLFCYEFISVLKLIRHVGYIPICGPCLIMRSPYSNPPEMVVSVIIKLMAYLTAYLVTMTHLM